MLAPPAPSSELVLFACANAHEPAVEDCAGRESAFTARAWQPGEPHLCWPCKVRYLNQRPPFELPTISTHWQRCERHGVTYAETYRGCLRCQFERGDFQPEDEDGEPAQPELPAPGDAPAETSPDPALEARRRAIGALSTYRAQHANPPVSNFHTPDDARELDYRARDLVLNPRKGHCMLGKGWLVLDRGDKRYASQYRRCLGGKCSHCIDYWLLTVLGRALDYFEQPDVLHRSRFPSLQDFKRNVRGRRLREASPVWFWTRAPDGSLQVFTSEPVPESEPCADPVLDLLDALLDTKAYPGRGHARHSRLPAVEREPDPNKRYVPLAHSRPPQTVNAILQYKLGRELAWEETQGRRSHSFSYKWETALAEEELPLADEVLDFEEELAREELEELHERRRYASEMRDVFRALGLGGGD